MAAESGSNRAPKRNAAAISESGTLAAGGGCDGLVRLWSLPSGRHSATLLQPAGLDATGNEGPLARIDWLALTPGGHVAGSASLIKMLTWRAGGVLLPAAVSRAACVDPGVVAKATQGDPDRRHGACLDQLRGQDCVLQ
jgi:hypothetical protein